MSSLPSINYPDCPDPVLRTNAQGMARVAVDGSTLIVTFERSVTQTYLLNPRSYTLTGGQRLFPHIIKAALYNPPGTPADLKDRRVLLTLTGEGDFSIYTLTVSGPDIDPFFASHKLRFRLDCDDPFDCREPVNPPPPEPEIPVAIDYLSKDYASFRQALIEFIPTRLPAWTERSEADLGMMLLELFAYTADNLSYMQDRVGNEAFLETATQRRSVAGHLALIGYQMDEGAAAYTWLQFEVNSLKTLGARLRVTNKPRRTDEAIIVFETIGTTQLRPEHNASQKIRVYSWDNQACCLPQESLSAALVGKFDQLAAGDYLLFDDGAGRRDIVRLTAPPEIIPPDSIKAKPDGPLTVVRWSKATPLHYDYCTDDVIASANLAVATHGETIFEETLRSAAIPARRPRYRLDFGPLAHLDAATLALVGTPTPAPDEFARPTARSLSTLALKVDGQSWLQAPSLLDYAGDDEVYRVEIDDQGDATVVFGDGTFGQRPDETAKVTATYRVGGGGVGNLSADTLVLPRPRENESIPWLDSVTNPLPAVGGRNLEARDHARRFAPVTFQKPLVAVTAADYEKAAQDFSEADGSHPIQRADAAFRWTGSWLTVTLAVDPGGTEKLEGALRQALLDYLDTRRLAGYDLEVLRAEYVPLEIIVEFCLADGFRAADVQGALKQALGSGLVSGGKKGFFHPDNFSFGDSLFVSQLYAAIMAVPGIESAQIARLARLHAARPNSETRINLAQGYLALGADQIIRLDNDRNFPENGILTIQGVSQ